MMATPDQPRQTTLDALSGGEVYQPAVYFDTPGPTIGGPTRGVGACHATAQPAPTMPAVPTLRPPAVDANGATAGARYAADMGQSPQELNVQVVRVPAESVRMVTQPQVPLVTARLADIRLNANVGNPAPTVLRRPAVVRGAAGDVSIHGCDYLDEVLGQLQRERDENMMLRDQLEMSGSGHWSPSQPPDRCAGNGQERLLTMDSKQLRERTSKQVEDEAKQMMEVFQLQPEDPLERVHGRLQQVMVRIGSMEDRLPTEGGVTERTAPPAANLPAVPQRSMPATGAITALAGAHSATGTEQSPQQVFVRVVEEPNGRMAPPAAPLPAVPQQIMPISSAIGATDGTPAATASGQSPQYSDVALLQRWFRKVRRAPRPNGNRNKLRRRACSESMLIFGAVSIKLAVVRRSCRKNVGNTTPTVAAYSGTNRFAHWEPEVPLQRCRSSICACWTRRTSRGASGTV